jgi:hypothetical protein
VLVLADRVQAGVVVREPRSEAQIMQGISSLLQHTQLPAVQDERHEEDEEEEEDDEEEEEEG